MGLEPTVSSFGSASMSPSRSSVLQAALHPSPESVLPSSQDSECSFVLLPQMGWTAMTLQTPLPGDSLLSTTTMYLPAEGAMYVGCSSRPAPHSSIDALVLHARSSQLGSTYTVGSKFIGFMAGT